MGQPTAHGQLRAGTVWASLAIWLSTSTLRGSRSIAAGARRGPSGRGRAHQSVRRGLRSLELLGVGLTGGTPEAVVVDAAGVALEQHAEALGVAVDGKVPELDVR